MTGSAGNAPPPRFAEVATIAVLRPNGVGDFVFALPALAALRETYPQARIVLLGKPWHKVFLDSRTPLVDEVVALPPVPGVGAPPGAICDAGAIESFCALLRRRGFDLACQMFGGGRYSNPFLLRLDARHTVGLRTPGAAALERSLLYVPWQNERLRLLEVAALAGARTATLEPLLPVLQRDETELGDRLPLPPHPLAVLSPGASDARRRWSIDRFAEVGDALVRAGALVVVQGSADERQLSAGVVAAMRMPAIDAGGLLSLDGLAALLQRARLVVASDSGPLHLAHALGTPTVGIYWLKNLFVSAPLTAARHRHTVSLRLQCPVCGRQNLDSRCGHDPSFVDDVEAAEVTELALELWRDAQASPAARAPAPAPR
ncbi:glycosyltransferase family 9 protein [Aromatoleum anaerobium]|uniref:Glycosyltransferase family 9 protein n=1 Tax=Aromatoleum anaerobium TaxID=182180 RepID=A0ABX1PKG8_9RHOO|nr:glycosyltransferase family 9 protein [Aromatoleum anaerobium]MCK0508386.1 glycosyltransferase family 9 protein [Aromatoleum anaerobium]